MKRSVYYAHSIALYGTEQEKRDIIMLEALGFRVSNPNNPAHDMGYKKSGMLYFRCVVVTQDALAFRANPDGSINAGVAQEIAWARDAGKPVIELPCGVARRTLTVDETREHLKDQGAR